MEDEPNALGPVGNFFMAALLIFLCGLSFFSTVGRQFQVGRCIWVGWRAVLSAQLH